MTIKPIFKAKNDNFKNHQSGFAAKNIYRNRSKGVCGRSLPRGSGALRTQKSPLPNLGPYKGQLTYPGNYISYAYKGDLNLFYLL